MIFPALIPVLYAAALLSSPLVHVKSNQQRRSSPFTKLPPETVAKAGWFTWKERFQGSEKILFGKSFVENKQKLGVPDRLRSCHTAIVEEYVIEGHVPADLIHTMLKEKPPIVGLAVPGTPVVSPGMEGPKPKPL